MNKTVIWLSFDLGVRGDYEGMYAFWDSHQALECGDSNACLKFEYEQDLIAELKTAIEQQVTLNRRTRIYVIFRDTSGEYKLKANLFMVDHSFFFRVWGYSLKLG